MEEDKKSEIRQAVISLLARREYSRVEIERKYRGKYDYSQLAEVMDWMAEQGLQSDKRFAEMLVRHTVGKGQGYLKLIQKAKEKGISEFLIKSALEKEEIDWYQVSAETYMKKYSDLPDKQDKKAQDRRMRFMLSRGFNYDQIKYAAEVAAESLGAEES